VKWIFNRYTLVLALLAAGGGWYWKTKTATSSKSSEPTGIVERTDIVQRVTLSGLVVPNRTATLTAPYDGYVQKIFVKVSEQVKHGQPIVSISQTPDGRGEEIFPLRAPLSGKVVQILKSEGADVLKSGADAAVVRIDDVSKLFIVCDTPELDYPKLKIDQRAIVKASSLPDKSYEGRITELAQAAKSQEKWDRSRVEFATRIEVVNKDEDIKPGMSVTIDIITAEAKDVLALRHDFVGKDGEEYFVVKADGSKQKVEVGMRSADAFEIKTGIAEGETVRQVDFLAAAKPTSGNRRRGRRD
jgi:multidrug efflux pump subunit AcrA (membrane-fusion protein)